MKIVLERTQVLSARVGVGQGQMHLLSAGLVCILWSVVWVIADTAAVHASPLLHEITLCAVNTSIGSSPFTQTNAKTETKPQQGLQNGLLHTSL
jgi:hypothetical protein